jgi:hypothetical protein
MNWIEGDAGDQQICKARNSDGVDDNPTPHTEITGNYTNTSTGRTSPENFIGVRLVHVS